MYIKHTPDFFSLKQPNLHFAISLCLLFHGHRFNHFLSEEDYFLMVEEDMNYEKIFDSVISKILNHSGRAIFYSRIAHLSHFLKSCLKFSHATIFQLLKPITCSSILAILNHNYTYLLANYSYLLTLVCGLRLISLSTSKREPLF